MGTVETLSFGLLGPLRVRRGQAAVELGGRKRRALLALLLLHANELVPREQLIDGLWGDVPPDNARSASIGFAGRRCFVSFF